MIKKITSSIMVIMVALTFTLNNPQEVKAEPEVKALINNPTNIKLIEGPVLMSLLVSTIVSVLLSIGISITRYGVEQLLKEWNINSEEYGEELNNQFNSVGDKLIVGAKTLSLVYRVRRHLLSQGLTNNGSINIGSSSVSPGYKGIDQIGVLSNAAGSVDISFTGDSYTTTVKKIVTYASPTINFVTGIRYYLIELDTSSGQHNYYTPIVSISNTSEYKLGYLNYVFSDKQKALNFIETFKNEMTLYGSYYYNFNPQNLNTLGSVDIATGTYTASGTTNYKYAVIVYKLEKGTWGQISGTGIGTYTTSINITKNPNTESNIPIVSESTETVTAGKIDLTDWQKVNPNYTYELQLENKNDSAIINSNQALIDAINSNTVAIKNQQVIDKNTGLTVTEINTNVIGISGILNGISNVITSIKEWFISLVQPITNIFTKTYTIEEINALAWVNVINELVLAIQNGITQILPFYQDNIGSILNSISHPQTNLLTAAVNNILTNTNLYWAVYGIAAIIFMKGVLR